MIAVGIDPGKKGAIAVVERKAGKSKVLLIDDNGDLYDDSGASNCSMNPVKLKNWWHENIIGNDDIPVNDLCGIGVETPIFTGLGMSIKTTMSMFESYGVIRSTLSLITAKSVVFRGIKPQDWIYHWDILYHPKERRSKEESIILATTLFPDQQTLFFGKKGGGKDGRAEAVLIATYVLDWLWHTDNEGNHTPSDE